MAVNIPILTNTYFAYDKPVPYHLKCGYDLLIRPVVMKDAIVFFTSYNILDIDKNISSEIEVIQMSYLQYLSERVLIDDINKQRFLNICILCLDCNLPWVRLDEKNKWVLSSVVEEEGLPKELWYITAKEFDDIKKIILYQNLPNYDDSYINPELKENMIEMDRLKTQNIEFPSFERRMSIITAHTGILKKDQLNMTIREHSLLFNEVKDEVDYIAMKSIATYAGHPDEVQWIYAKSKGKYEDYITSVDQYSKSMGKNIIKST